VELPVGFGDGVGGEQGVLLAISHHLTDTWCVYLAIYDDVRDVYPLRPELPRHGLRQRPQAELADRERRENFALPRSAADAPVSKMVPCPASAMADSTSRAA
jgi:hypothetical protein